MLMAANYTLPYKIFVHGMLTIDGEKMSKSRGTFILADTFKQYINSESLRYYFACKLSHRSEDIDLNFNDFLSRVNTDLVNKMINLISRCLPLLHRYFMGKVSFLDTLWDPYQRALELTSLVKDLYIDNESSKAITEILRFCEEANKYVQDQAPWNMAKTDPNKAQVVLTTAIYAGKVCLGLLKPVLPCLVRKVEIMLNEGMEYDFLNITTPFTNNQILGQYEHLLKRIEQEDIKAMIETSKQEPKKELANPPSNLINIDQFMSVDLRAAKVLKAEDVLGSDKLIACRLDIGPLGERTIFTGLRPHVKASDLLDNMVIVVANLAPRTMRFGTSEGMILAYGDEIAKPIFVNGANPGDRIR
jgi:methionyl-tRNA synthetase